MRIAVVSDTHSHSFSINKIYEYIQDADMMIHLGDNVEDVETLEKSFKGKILNVRGNCDYNSFVPKERLEVIEGKRIFMTHGDRYNVKYDLLRLKYRAKEVEADIVLFGHTHEYLELHEEGIWFINPGSAALPRDSSRSIVMLEIADNKVQISHRKIT
jgi:putative phosphoesterase